jgi:hypothetical protein
MSVAGTILSQLGGRKFITMTGASSFASGEDCLTFRLPQRMVKRNGRAMRIVLAGDDTYTLELLKQNKELDVIVVDKRTGVYCEMLPRTFTDMTGLYTTLAGAV